MRETFGLTPSQTAGPFLSIGLLRDLVPAVLVDPSDPRAVRIRGHVIDGDGDGVVDALVEIWQADGAGRYGTPAFPGFGRSGTDSDGSFEFVTLKPGRVPWPGGGLQAPHIAVGIFARGLLKRLVTRLYFPDEGEANESDPVLAALLPSQRATLVAETADDGLTFDVHLQGPAQTTFFAV